MKHTLTINQRVVVQKKYPLDLVDCVILDFLKDYLHRPKVPKKLLDNLVYYQINWHEIVEALPLIGVATRQGIGKRLKRLCECQVLIIHPDNQRKNQSFYGFGERYAALYFDTSADEQETATVTTYSFEAFWNAYNKKEGSKEKVKSLWQKIKPDVQAKIMAGLPAYVASFLPDRKQYMPYPQKFLSEKRYECESFIHPSQPTNKKNEPGPAIRPTISHATDKDFGSFR